MNYGLFTHDHEVSILNPAPQTIELRTKLPRTKNMLPLDAARLSAKGGCASGAKGVPSASSGQAPSASSPEGTGGQGSIRWALFAKSIVKSEEWEAGARILNVEC